jgi:hypothetical protein
VRASQHFRSFWGAWRTIAGYEAIHMIRKGQACWGAAGAKVYCTASFSICSLRRAKFPIIYPDLRRDYKVATHPFGKTVVLSNRCYNVFRTAAFTRDRIAIEATRRGEATNKTCWLSFAAWS